jgi:lysophospholipase L1-like esterase
VNRRWPALTLLLFALLIAFSSPTDASNRPVPTLLALGDSIAFGWVPGADDSDPATMIGYPDLIAQHLGLRDVNAACPGEATGGFLSPTGTDNGCRPYRALHPLHVAYRGTQLAFAVRYLQSHRDVQLVTLDLGANDILLLHTRCRGSATCYAIEAPALLAEVAANLRRALGELRATGYKGQLVVLQYYALIDNVAGIADTEALNATIAAAARPSGAIVPDGLQAFARVSGTLDYCAAGLVVAQTADRCDIHPSPEGAHLLAQTVLGLLGPPVIHPPA